MPVRRLKSKAVAVGLLATHGSANAFGSRDKVAVYWGQNSFGSSGQQAQQSLATYCANTDIDIIPISFLLQMSSGQGGVPVVNFANSGNGCGTFAGTQLLDCPQISKDIQTCQDQYKKTILLSIGGATYTEGGFKTEQAAVNMANLIWNMFGPPGSNAAGIAADMTAMEAPMITSSFGFGNVSTATILARGALPTNTPAEFLSLDTNIAPVLPSSTGLFLNASTGWQSASQSAVTYSDEGVEGDAVSTDPAAGAAAITQLEPLIPGQTTSRTPSSSPRSSTTSSRQTTPSSKSTTKSTTSSSRSSGSLTQLDPSIPGVSSSKTTSSSSKLTATSSKTTTTTSRAPTTSSSVPSPPAMAPSGMTLVTYTFRTTYTSIETKYETRTESIRDQGFTRNLNIDGTATDTAGNSEATSPADDGSEQGTAATVLRPFHSVSVDGFDLDIEAPTQNFVPFAKRLRALMNAANTDANLNRQFYLTVAPQCPYPDVNNDAMLNGGVEFDAVFVQFYNNYCGIQSFIPGAATQWNYNFDTWNKWAVNGSANPNVKVFIGVPAGPTAAGSGYLSVANLKPVIEYSKKFSSFGGIMAWDASQAYVNTGFLSGIKAALVGQVAAPSSTTSRSSSSSATSSTTRSTTQSTTASTTRSTTASPSPVTSSLSTTRSTTRSTTQFTTPSTTPSTTRTTTQSTTRSTTTSPTSKTTTATVTTPSNVFSGVPVISSTTASTSAVPSPPTYAAPPPPPSYKEEFRQFVRGLW